MHSLHFVLDKWGKTRNELRHLRAKTVVENMQDCIKNMIHRASMAKLIMPD
tara:strand:+ start:833 stop:985 length:153 start_codon:yes stop_codon:yes gene_type:complete